MNVLWITNIVFPEAQALLIGKELSYASGGWMIGAAEALAQHTDVTLYIASLSREVMQLVRLEGKRKIYYMLPYGKGNNRVNHEYEPYWRQIHDEIHPDVIHIHGTELSHGLAYVEACGNKHVVVSIQGLTSVIAKYYDYGLSKSDVLRSITLRDIVRGSIYHDKKTFRQRGGYEVDLIKKVNHIIGRTNWDRAHTWVINPNANYHSCNEILRDAFYVGQWKYDQCKKHQIFISQANYPIKGFHQLLRALPFVIKEFPDVRVRVAGGVRVCNTFKQKMMISGYSHFIMQLIDKLHLESHICFLGTLNEIEMKQEYLSANLFVCPSSIENSPNSLCEAQILGVPVLAAFVGGIPDLMQGDEEHLYRFEEVEMLAMMICNAFRSSDSFVGDAERERALIRHDKTINVEQLFSIYKTVSDETESGESVLD